MVLSDLLRETPCELVQGSTAVEISTLVYDTRQMVPGGLFIAIVGTRFDPHTALIDMAEQGAAAVLISRLPGELPEETLKALAEKQVTVLYHREPRRALASLSVTFFGHPMEKLTVIGMTGTKGKTTSTHMLLYILEAAGKKAGLIGTNGIRIGEEFYRTRYTTPEAFELQQYAARMVEKGFEYLIMEVSSTGLKYGRVDGISYDCGVFTNLSPDHIGTAEHPDFADYRYSKSLLFRRCRLGIFNMDDENFTGIQEGHTCEMITFGKNLSADCRIASVDYVREGDVLGCRVSLTGRDTMEFFVGMPGYFNAQNGVCAALTARELGIGIDAIRRGLAGARVNGRMELVFADDRFSVLVDYAHNGLSARTLLETLRNYPHRRLVVVFGSGGNRDPHRRYEMGEACGSLADLSIITADNSRFEPVENIMKDIHIGLDPTGGASVDIPDRREAIRYAVQNAREGDIIAVIGKGHEDYQEVNGVRTHFLDREEIEAAVKELVCS